MHAMLFLAVNSNGLGTPEATRKILGYYPEDQRIRRLVQPLVMQGERAGEGSAMTARH
jgi:hypothetical protein